MGMVEQETLDISYFSFPIPPKAPSTSMAIWQRRPTKAQIVAKLMVVDGQMLVGSFPNPNPNLNSNLMLSG